MTVADETYLNLREMLVAGRFKAGEKLREPDLAASLGVSRTPLREALRSLEAEGLVSLSGRGAMVKKTSPEEVHDLYLYRAVLEGFTAEQAAVRNRNGELSPAAVSKLWSLVSLIEETDNASSRVNSNIVLHRYVAELSGNYSASEALARVWAQIAISSAENMMDASWREEVHDQHREIAAAIDVGDPQRAFQAGRSHVQTAADVFSRMHLAHVDLF
jgi:DNA-binding GntR family transcriptional regulator